MKVHIQAFMLTQSGDYCQNDTWLNPDAIAEATIGYAKHLEAAEKELPKSPGKKSKLPKWILNITFQSGISRQYHFMSCQDRVVAIKALREQYAFQYEKRHREQRQTG